MATPEEELLKILKTTEDLLAEIRHQSIVDAMQVIDGLLDIRKCVIDGYPGAIPSIDGNIQATPPVEEKPVKWATGVS